MPLRLLLAALWSLAAAMPAAAQGVALAPPREIVLYPHNDLRHTGFVELLVCALERVLTAPIRVKKLDLPLGPELRATPSQFDVAKLAEHVAQATAASTPPNTFRYLLLPHDLKSSDLRYVFATTFRNPATNLLVGVVSTARLDPSIAVRREHGADIIAARTYKLVLKSVARLSGLWEAECCVLSFPRDRDELDLKAAEFCPGDRAALVAAGVLKPREEGGCALIAEAPSAVRLSALREAAPTPWAP